MAAMPLSIPIFGSEEEIEIPADELPDDASEIMDILRDERAPPEVWTQIAVAYNKQGKKDQFARVLELTNATLSTESSTEAITKRIEVLNSLAAFQLEESKAQNTDSREAKAKKDEHMTKAVRHINDAASLAAENNDVDETNSAAGTWVVRGELQLLQGNKNQAKSSFENATRVLEGYIPAQLAKARMAFNEGEYKEALKMYCASMQAKPDCPAEVRLGIALCYYRLKQPELARKAFTRVLGMCDPSEPNVDALMGLAILELNDSDNDATEAIKVAVSYAKTAYDLGTVGQTNPKVLNYLANHFFFTKQYTRTEELAIKGFHHSADEAIKAESCYSIARAYHVNRNYERAMQFYIEAVKRSKDGGYTKDGIGTDYVLPYYGLGQMYVWKGQYTEATTQFEEVIKSYPDDYDTLKVLGWLYAKQGQTASGEWSEYTKKGVATLRRAVAMRGDDIEVRLELAQLLETDSQRENTEEAKNHYRAAMKVMTRRSIEVRPEILSNVAVLYQRLADFETETKPRQKMLNRALKSLTQALCVTEGSASSAFAEFFAADGADEPTAAESADGGLEPTVVITPNQITAAYNLGLIFESLSRWGKAKMVYRSIVKVVPGYIDGWLRLAVLARDSSQVELAKKYFSEAEKNAPKAADGAKALPKTIDAIILHGAMSLKLEKLGDAQKVFEQVVKKMDPQDVYSHVALGNIYFTVASDAAKFKGRDENTSQKEHKNQGYAMMNYRRAFDLSKKRSIHAANGVGMVLVEQGFLEEAKLIFQRVRESTEDFPDGWTNLAHLYVAEKEYFQAIKLYEKCNKKFYSNADTGLLQYIARALYDWSKDCQDKGDLEMATEKMRECQRQCERSLHIDPTNHISWFNLAVAKLAAASCVIKQAEPTEEGVQQAMGELDQAKKMFSNLGESTATEKELGFKKAKAVENVNACDSRRNDADAALGRAQERDEKLKTDGEKRAEALAKLKGLQDAKQAAEQAERDRIKAAKDEMVRAQAEKRQRVLDALANAQMEDSVKKSPSKKGKRKKGDDDEPEGQFEGDDDDEAKRQKTDEDSGAAPTNEELFGSDSSDDDEPSALAKKDEKKTDDKENKKGDGSDDDLDLEDSSDDEKPKKEEAAEKKPEEKKEEEAKLAKADDNDDDLNLDDDDDEKPAEKPAEKSAEKSAEAPASVAEEVAAAAPTEGEEGEGDAPAKKKARVVMESDSDDD